ncbi:cytokine receptor-like factor 2 [Colossoma macropomum]|uniref:cytokine receptor-like factor 2 n=1 Tax=Colossoma macropomum TaxID=42526 RepID=UPI001863EC9E|nr:cytokine receptor-like factor 2 [Colossoma macropomum]
MQCWNRWVLLVLSVVLCFQIWAESSSADSINMRISNTSDSITVTWENPNKSKNNQCYRFDVQYRHLCDSSWKSVNDIKGFSFKLPAPDMKKNYVFRIRARLYCINGNWSKWSPEKYWRNDTGLCIAETSPVSIRDYLLVTVLPVTCLLLVFAITQERVRRLVLPIIPDPKHTQERILNIEQFQWFTSFSETCEECEIVEIEVDSEREDQKSEITEEQPLQKPTDASPESHDIGLIANISMYSLDSPEVNTVPQCSHTMPGYIVI